MAQSPGAAGLESSIAEIASDWQVPGLAVAVVRRGEVILAAGFGVREVGSDLPVTSATLFSIGSCTKAFTAAAIGTLVEEERLNWDDPAIRYLDDFAMPDPADTGRVTVRDLLGHRTGLTGGDLISWGSSFSRREIVERVPYLEQTAPLRSEYHYDNNTYVAAGEVAAAVAGMSWDQLVSRRLLLPLAMDATVTTITAIADGADRASPHAVVNGELRPIAPMNEDNCAAAGSIWSSVDDMTRWMRMLLARGAWEGQTVLGAEAVDEMFQMQTPIRSEKSDTSLPPAVRPTFEGYGMGWELLDYRGHKVVRHGGQTDGMVAQVTLVPDLDLGLVILLNRHDSDAFKPVEYLILDAMLGVDQPVEWSRVMRPPDPSIPAAPLRAAAAARPRGPGFNERYTGRYTNPAVGSAAIVVKDGRLSLVLDRTPLYGGSLEHLTGDTFLVRRSYPLVDPSPVEFHTDPHGSIVGFTMLPDATEWLASMPYRFDRSPPENDQPDD